MFLMLQCRSKTESFRSKCGKLAFKFGEWENIQLIDEPLTDSERKELTESDWFSQYRLIPVMVAE